MFHLSYDNSLDDIRIRGDHTYGNGGEISHVQPANSISTDSKNTVLKLKRIRKCLSMSDITVQSDFFYKTAFYSTYTIKN